MNLKSKSWLDLAPLEVNYGNIEAFEDYFDRMKLKTDFGHIPKEIFSQWLWAHHTKEESILNYAWLDYRNIEFQLCTWANEQFANINEQFANIYVIENYKSYYNSRAHYTDLSNFCCTSKDLEEWKKHGTWRMPPIILDVNSIKEKIPGWCELVTPYQLVEGHSRLGYLKSMFTIDALGKGKVADRHQILLMKYKNRNPL